MLVGGFLVPLKAIIIPLLWQHCSNVQYFMIHLMNVSSLYDFKILAISITLFTKLRTIHSKMKSYPVCCKTVAPFALARRPFTIRVENISETAQNWVHWTHYQPCSRKWFFSCVSYKMLDHLFAVISCSAWERVLCLLLPSNNIGTFVKQTFKLVGYQL